MTPEATFFDVLLRLEIRLWNELDDVLQQAHAVSLGRLQTLRTLRDRGGNARVQDVADDLVITVGAASKLVDRLERDGSARRTPNPTDRRSSLITLTPAGEAALEAGLATFEEALSQRLTDSEDKGVDLTEVTATLDRLLQLLDRPARREARA